MRPQSLPQESCEFLRHRNPRMGLGGELFWRFGAKMHLPSRFARFAMPSGGSGVPDRVPDTTTRSDAVSPIFKKVELTLRPNERCT